MRLDEMPAISPEYVPKDFGDIPVKERCLELLKHIERALSHADNRVRSMVNDPGACHLVHQLSAQHLESLKFYAELEAFEREDQRGY
jgi:hypothetical protein